MKRQISAVLLDAPDRYGVVSRLLHWLMAALLGWQLAGALLYVSVGDMALTRFVGGRHLELGTVLSALVILRTIWAWINRGRRAHRQGLLGRAASAGHAMLYGLMILVPAIGLLRQYGSGKAFSVFGQPLMPERGTKIEWMLIPADLLHYWLGFLLLAAALGHAGFAIAHRVSGDTRPLRKML